MFGKHGAERLAASRGAGKAGEVLPGCGCEQMAESMHSSLKKAGGLKNTDPWTLHRVTPTTCVLLRIPLAQKYGHRFFQESLLLQYNCDLNAFLGKWRYTSVCVISAVVKKEKLEKDL